MRTAVPLLSGPYPHSSALRHPIANPLALSHGRPCAPAQTFFGFAVVTNLLVSLSMLQGCVSVINTLTGVNLYAISFLIPIGVVVYATIGGAALRSMPCFLQQGV